MDYNKKKFSVWAAQSINSIHISKTKTNVDVINCENKVTVNEAKDTITSSRLTALFRPDVGSEITVWVVSTYKSDAPEKTNIDPNNETVSATLAVRDANGCQDKWALEKMDKKKEYRNGFATTVSYKKETGEGNYK